MDLGIKGREALLCASSKGLGKACALALSREGVTVWINGRNQGPLDEAAAEIRAKTGGTVHTVKADINTDVGRKALVAACPEPDMLINNNEGPPPGKLADWDEAQWLAALGANMLPAVLLIRAVIPGMQARKFGRIVNITSAMVKSPRPHMGLSTAARAALTAFSKSQSFEVMADNVTINNLLPERIKTGRQEFMAKRMVQADGITMDEAYKRIAATLAAKRMGTAEEFGDACAYLCSAQAGFISGQNLQLDGGSYAGLI
jgi:3-oxoacyl-[acyl-carrier protein] reductase